MNRVAQYALLGFAFVLPWEDAVVLPLLGSIGRVSGLVLLAVALPSLVRGAGLRLRLPSAFLLFMAAFVLWSCLSLLWSLDPAATLGHALTRIQLLALAYLVWQLLETPAHALGVMRAYVLGCYAAVGGAVLNYLTGAEATWQRYSVAGTDPNDFATMLALGIPMAWFLIHRGRQDVWFWPLLLYLPVVLGAILLTSSRGGALVTLVALTVVPLTLGSLALPRRIAFWFVVAVGALGVAYAFPYVYDAVAPSLQRLSSTADELAVGTLNERAEIWEAGFSLFEENAPLGVGAGAFESSVARFLGTPKVAHNTYISVLVELGPLGLLLFGACLLAVAAPILRLPRVERIVLLVMLATLLIGLVPLTWEVRKVTWFVLVLITAFGTTIVVPRRGETLAA